LILTVWRIIKRKHAKTAFTGEGARLYGGRWNSPGVAVIYTAQSQSLAALEMLVHLDSSELLDQYVIFGVDVEGSLIRGVEASKLPRDWRADPSPPGLKAIGDEWVAAGSSAVLRVPSVLVAGESNFLINPRHSDFSKLRIGEPVPFRFDPRLKTP
jgi:RES domain-containing protein